ncbi:hypothetical protein [Streptomyces roseicoloratus]|uniref:DUF3325 domain-containing protein n=1 Tax=Streptomyces roseicoloratus TaxID=2508722 RepID=A0ABY9RN96_9ACTN|nr:hypothetical protein [Streptomyces roseicoloratus]WMX43657.1 hypothetical protein RGF97_00520 [Streptomyces roseicoloratus]
MILALTAAVAAALLVCRLALRERAAPGTARRALAFTRDRRAVAAGLLAGLLLAGLGWRAAGPGALAWAGLAAVLVAALTSGSPGSADGEGPAPGARAAGTGPEGSRDQE